VLIRKSRGCYPGFVSNHKRFEPLWNVIVDECTLRTDDFLSSGSKPNNGALKVQESPRKPSKTLAFDDATEVWRQFNRGEFQNRIAAALDVNPARISEIIKRKKFPGSEEVANRKDPA
jgi:hypothetical protein